MKPSFRMTDHRVNSGLDYSSSWRAVQAGSIVKSGPKSIIFALQTELLSAPPTISVDRANCKMSTYRLKSFAWFAVLDLAQPEVATTVSATLKLTGTKAKGQPVTTTCSYKGGQVVTPVLGNGPTPQTCTLPACFDLLTDIRYEVTSASTTAATAEIIVTQIDYVLEKCC